MPAYTSGSLTGSNLEIGIALVLQDRFSNQAREASSQIKRLHNEAKMAVTANLQSAKSMADTVMGWSGRALGGISSMLQEGAGFVDTMTTVKAITAASDTQMKQLADTAQSLGIATMFDSKEIASGMQYLAMAGNTAEEIQQMIEGAAYVAGATNMALGGKGGTADLITNVMSTFQIEAAGAATVGDQLAKAALSSNMSMIDLAEAVKYAGADMVNLKRTLPEVAALAGVLGNAGIQGSMAGTAMSNMARYLNKSLVQPSYKGGKALATLGLSIKDFTDSNGDLIDLSAAIGKIVGGMKGLSSMEVAQVFNDIFGVRGNRAAAALARSLPEYEDLLNKILNQSEGYAKSIVEQRMETIAGGIDQMRSALENLRTTFTTVIAPVITPVFKRLAQFFEFVRNILTIPVLGPALTQFITFGTTGVFLIATFTKLKAAWKLLTMDSQVSFLNMIRVIKGGWGEATWSLSRYMALERAANATRKGGLAGINPRMSKAEWAMMNGMPVGGIYIGADGRPRYAKGNQAGKRAGTFASVDATQKAMTGKGAATAAGAGGFFAGLFGKSAAKTAAAGAARAGFGAFAGRGLLAVGGRLVGLLGGPIGVGISILTLVLPSLISALTGNKEATDANTDAANKVANQYGNLVERNKANKFPGEDQILTQMYNAMQYWAEQIRNIKPTAVINLNVDGKPTIRETVEDMQGETNLTFGMK
jgi:TP901 family phage tail tape measure protein|nr:MAG TPA: minor tail protein [Caudoviricetes sp.]